MAVNHRDHIDGLTTDNADNYEFFIGYHQEDLEKPAYIRKSILPDKDGILKR
jgi:hypothetical protein